MRKALQYKMFRLLALSLGLGIALLGLVYGVSMGRAADSGPGVLFPAPIPYVASAPQASMLEKSVTPAGTVGIGDYLTYTVVISAFSSDMIHFVDPINQGLAWQGFVGSPPSGLDFSTAQHMITGTVAVTAGQPISVLFKVQVFTGAPGTIQVGTSTVSNTAYYYYEGETIGDRRPSNTVSNQVFRPGYVYLPMLVRNYPPEETPTVDVCLTPEEAELVRLVNEYRNQNGLPDVPASKSLTLVGQWHVLDLHENEPDSGTDPRGYACNMHSWSDQHPELWSPVCYTSDHEYANGMWNKPNEITGGDYHWTGYEDAYGSSGQATAEGALSAWKNSPGHNAVILETGIWEGKNWPAMGVGIYEHHAVLWFGDGTDPLGTVGECP